MGTTGFRRSFRFKTRGYFFLPSPNKKCHLCQRKGRQRTVKRRVVRSPNPTAYPGFYQDPCAKWPRLRQFLSLERESIRIGIRKSLNSKISTYQSESIGSDLLVSPWYSCFGMPRRFQDPFLGRVCLLVSRMHSHIPKQKIRIPEGFQQDLRAARDRWATRNQTGSVERRTRQAVPFEHSHHQNYKIYTT